MGFDFSSLTETEEEKERKRKEKELALGKPVDMPIIDTQKTAPIKVDFGSFVMPVEDQPEEDKIWRIDPKTGKRVHTPDWKLQAGVGHMPTKREFYNVPDWIKDKNIPEIGEYKQGMFETLGEAAGGIGKELVVDTPKVTIGTVAKKIAGETETYENLLRGNRSDTYKQILADTREKYGIKPIPKSEPLSKGFVKMLKDFSKSVDEDKSITMPKFARGLTEQVANVAVDLPIMKSYIKGTAGVFAQVFKKKGVKVAEKIIKRHSNMVGMALHGAMEGISREDLKATLIGGGSGALMGKLHDITKIIKPKLINKLANVAGFGVIAAGSETATTGEIPNLLSDEMIYAYLLGLAFEVAGWKGKPSVGKLKPGDKPPPIIDVTKVPKAQKGIIEPFKEIPTKVEIKPIKGFEELKSKPIKEIKPKEKSLLETLKESKKTVPEFEVYKEKENVKKQVYEEIKKGTTGVVRFTNVGEIKNILQKGKMPSKDIHGQPIRGKDTVLEAYGNNKEHSAAILVPEKYIIKKPDAHTSEAYIDPNVPIGEIKFFFGTQKKSLTRIEIASKLKSEMQPVKSIKEVVAKGEKEFDELVVKIPKEKISATETIKALDKIGVVDKPTDALAKLREVIEKSPTERKHLEEAYTKERAKRFAAVEEVSGKLSGEKRFFVSLKKMEGPLAEQKSKTDFSEVGSKLPQKVKDNLMDMVFEHSYLTTPEKLSTGKELQGIYSGKIPTPKGLVYLEEVFGKNLIKDILAKRRMGLKFVDFATELVNIPKALLATADMSGFLRQGAVLVASHPILSAKAMKDTFKFAFSPKAFLQYFKELHNHKYYSLIRKFKLALTNPTTSGLGAREDLFISRILQKIPGLGHVVRFAERSYVGFLNKLRVDTFSLYADELMSKGFTPTKNAKMFKAAADVVNTFSGRGTLGKLDNFAQPLNTMFFSPRLISARFHALNPVWYGRMPKPVRVRALKDFGKFVTVGMTTLALIEIMGGDNVSVEKDPRSSDFGKIRIGNTRWDIWGGFQQWARTFAQFALGETKSTVTGEIRTLDKDKYPFTTRKDIGQRFIENKLAPVPSLINELISGAKTFSGEDMTIENTLWEKLIPMYIQDITEAFNEDGLWLAVRAGVPAFFGVGVQTWGPRGKTKADKIETLRKTQKGLTRRMNKLRNEGKLTAKLMEEYKKRYDKIEQQIRKYSSGAS